jgi:hypothetical protein
VKRYARASKRRIPGQMNKTEEAYSIILEAKKRNGEIREYAYESLTLKLAKDTRLTVDFMVIASDDTLEMHEVKGGFVREDAWMKLKIAAQLFPFRFRLAQYKSKSWTIADVEAS